MVNIHDCVNGCSHECWVHQCHPTTAGKRLFVVYMTELQTLYRNLILASGIVLFFIVCWWYVTLYVGVQNTVNQGEERFYLIVFIICRHTRWSWLFCCPAFLDNNSARPLWHLFLPNLCRSLICRDITLWAKLQTMWVCCFPLTPRITNYSVRSHSSRTSEGVPLFLLSPVSWWVQWLIVMASVLGSQSLWESFPRSLWWNGSL